MEMAFSALLGAVNYSIAKYLGSKNLLALVNTERFRGSGLDPFYLPGSRDEFD